MFVLQNEVAEHQILSRSSSEPSQSTFQHTHTPDHIRTAGRCHTEENTPEQTGPDHLAYHHTDTDVYDDAHGVTHMQQKPLKRATVIKDKTQVIHVENETNDHRLEDKERDKKKDTNMKPLEREENTYTLRWVMLHVYCVYAQTCEKSSLKIFSPVYFTVVPSFQRHFLSFTGFSPPF